MSLKNYTDLDLSRESELAQDLFSRVDSESKRDEIVLSDHVGTQPANLTNAMAGWYRRVEPYRRAALDEVNAAFGRGDGQSGSEGIFLERAHSEIHDRDLLRKREVENRHRQENASLYESLDGARKDFDDADRNYRRLAARHGREAKLTPRWYIPALVGVGIGEVGINIDTFNALPPPFTPAIALFTSLIIALALALAAHLHGTFVCQLRSRFGPHADDGDRSKALWMFGIGSLALSAVLAIVYYARAIYLVDLLDEARLYGEEGKSALFVIGGSLLGNLLVWIIGVIIAFLAHDPDHTFPEVALNRRKKEQEVQSLRKTIEKPKHREFQQISARTENDRQQALNRDGSAHHTPAYKEGAELKSRLMSQDARVLDLLAEYRTRLVDRLAVQEGAHFVQQAQLASQTSEILTHSQYAAQPLSLNYH